MVLCLTVAAAELCTLAILMVLAAKHKASSYQALVRIAVLVATQTVSACTWHCDAIRRIVSGMCICASMLRLHHTHQGLGKADVGANLQTA